MRSHHHAHAGAAGSSYLIEFRLGSELGTQPKKKEEEENAARSGGSNGDQHGVVNTHCHRLRNDKR